MLEWLFGKTAWNNKRKLTALYKDIDKHSQFMRLKHKDENGMFINGNKCEIIKTEELKEIIEEHFDRKKETRQNKLR